MTSHRPLATFCAAALLFAACGSKPEPEPAASAAPAATETAAPSTGMAPPLAPGAELPPGHPPLDTTGAAGVGMISGHGPSTPSAGIPVVAAGEGGDQALVWETPSGWVAETPSSNMRRAQYRIPGAAGAAECVVFYFGPGQGGDAQGNAERWAAQFADAQGAPAVPRTRQARVGSFDVLYVEAAGTYLQGAMTGGAVEQKSGYALIAAVVEGPDANWFFKLTGPAATVEAQRAAFESMIGSIRADAADPAALAR
jgi:hypothetical protein